MKGACRKTAAPFFVFPPMLRLGLVQVVALLLRGVLWAQEREIVFCHYNLCNYIGAKAGEGAAGAARPKSEEEIAVLMRIIKDINPDILGVCEMGSPEQFADFKKRLAEAGLGYVDSEYVEAADPERHLALVSRFPIVARQSLRDVSFELNGVAEKVRRGFLDVTVQVNPRYQLRLVGAHFKSKLPTPAGEALVRRHEARCLREHLEKIMAAEPEVNLLCYGDLNDTKNEPMFAEVSGIKGRPDHMADLWAKDRFGDRWTYYWKPADQYSRIDYLFASPGLFREVILDQTRVYRSERNRWDQASDHRPVYTSIRPINR